jgi:hypothetical protein
MRFQMLLYLVTDSQLKAVNVKITVLATPELSNHA